MVSIAVSNNTAPAAPVADYDDVPHVEDSFEGEWQVLRRSGNKPLRIKGTVLAEATNWSLGTALWHEVTIYRRARGECAATIRVFKKSPSDKDVFHAETFSSIEEAMGWLESYSPADDVGCGFDVADAESSTAWAVINAAGLRNRVDEACRSYHSMLAEMLYQLDSAG